MKNCTTCSAGLEESGKNCPECGASDCNENNEPALQSEDYAPARIKNSAYNAAECFLIRSEK